jgi:molecular chaperone DnaK (HSP70)
MAACERLRKLLSQLFETSIIVENLTDNGDVSFTLNRDELSTTCSHLLNDFKQLITRTINSTPLVAVEVLGGGSRMQIVQNAISEVVGKVLASYNYLLPKLSL